MVGQPHPDEIIRLSEEYSSPRSAIIRAHIVMGVPRYFVERWVPVLGTAPATLVNTLRQLNYHTPDDAVILSGSALAREAAMSRRHLYTCLETPLTKAFVRVVPGQHVRAETGKVVQETNRYHIRMDAEYLLMLLRTFADNPIDAAQRAIAQKPRDLWAATPQQDTLQFTTTEAISALHVLRRAFPDWKPANTAEKTAFAQAAESLHDHVTLIRGDGRTSKIIVPQYFRQRWWKHLGHDFAWSYLWFRGIAYQNTIEGVARHKCWIASLDEVLTIINRPYEWWRRNVEHAKRKHGSAITDFFRQIDTQKGRDPAYPQRVARYFEVRLDLPIAPDDRTRYSKLLIEWPEETFDIELEDSQPLGAGAAPRTILSNTTQGPTQLNTGVPHKSTQSQLESLTQLSTPVPEESHTTEHTGLLGLTHISTQWSHTLTHRESKHLYKAPLNTSTISSSKHTEAVSIDQTSHAAAENNSYVIPGRKSLATALSEALLTAPHRPLYAIAPAIVWLAEGWKNPVQPHTPAWNIATSHPMTPRDLVALMLAVWADTTIEFPPRYLSWLMHQWISNPAVPPMITKRYHLTLTRLLRHKNRLHPSALLNTNLPNGISNVKLSRTLRQGSTKRWVRVHSPYAISGGQH